MTSSKVRIIGANGEISTRGRLEVLVNKIWSTVNTYTGGQKEADGTEKSAKLIMQNLAYNACTEMGYPYGIIVNEGPLISEANDLVNQIELFCEGKTGLSNCFLREILEINHARDTMVECQKIDPTKKERPEGTPAFYKPYPSAKSSN